MLSIAHCRPENEISKILDQETLRVANYFHALKRMLAPYESDNRRTPAKFLAIINRMEKWWRSQSGLSMETHVRDLRPFAKLSPPGEQASPSTENNTSPVGGSNDLSLSPFAGRVALDAVETTQISSAVGDAQTSVIDDQGFLLDSTVFSMDQDPATLLMADIDWSFFDSLEMISASG